MCLAVSFYDPHKHDFGKSLHNIFRFFFFNFLLRSFLHDSKLIEADFIISLEIRLILRVTLLCLLRLTNSQSILTLWRLTTPIVVVLHR